MTRGLRHDPIDAETRAELGDIVLPALGLRARDVARARIEQLAAPKMSGLPTVGIRRVDAPARTRCAAGSTVG